MKPFFTPERRICMVRCFEPERKERRAFFHLFTTRAYPIEPSPLRGGHPGGQVSEAVAIVEYEDGTVDTVEPSRVRFLDTYELMAQYSWGTEDDDNLTEWVPTKDPYFPFKCKKCGGKSIAALETGCPNCGRYLPKKEEPEK